MDISDVWLGLAGLPVTEGVHDDEPAQFLARRRIDEGALLLPGGGSCAGTGCFAGELHRSKPHALYMRQCKARK
eukprot:11713188-Prorocentrum_lima.AAC.1